MRTPHLLLILGLAALPFGCDDDATDTPTDTAEADTAEDSSSDTPEDTAEDTAEADTAEADTPEDTAQADTASDTASDTAQADTASDTPEDSASPSGPLCYAPDGPLIFPPTAVGATPTTGAFSYATLVATNCSDATVTVSNVGLAAGSDSDLQIEFLPFSGEGTLEPGESFRVELTFTPEAVGEATGSLEITHGDGVDSVALQAEGIADPGHCLIQVGHTLIDAADPSTALTTVEPTDAGGSFNDNFLLANVGLSPCTVSGITLEAEGDVFSFPFTSQVETPIELSFKQLKIINLQFAPDAPGEHTATLTVTSDDGSDPTHTMTARGVAR